MGFIYPVDELLLPISPENPCGVLDTVMESQLSSFESAIKMAAGNRFQELGRLADGFFRGGKIQDLSNPESQAQVEIKPIRHLLPAMVLTTAWLDNDGLPGFADGVSLIEGLLVSQWEKLHPQANPDVEEDPFYQRINFLNPLSIENPAKNKPVSGRQTTQDTWQIGERLLKIVFLQSGNHGDITLRDCLSPWAKSLGITLPPGEDRSKAFIHEVRLGSAENLPRQREAVENCIKSLGRIKDRFNTAEGSSKPRLDYLICILDGALKVLNDKVPEIDEAEEEEEDLSKDPNLKKNRGPVSSHEDAVRKLAEVAEYFRRNEPSSPLPHMIDRVKRLVGMNFMALLEELSLGDQAVPEFRKLAGIRESSPDTAAPKSGQ